MRVCLFPVFCLRRNHKLCNQSIVTILTKIEAMDLIIFTGKIAPSFLNRKHVFLRNSIRHTNFFSASVADDGLCFFLFFHYIAAHTNPSNEFLFCYALIISCFILPVHRKAFPDADSSGPRPPGDFHKIPFGFHLLKILCSGTALVPRHYFS